MRQGGGETLRHAAARHLRTDSRGCAAAASISHALHLLEALARNEAAAHLDRRCRRRARDDPVAAGVHHHRPADAEVRPQQAAGAPIDQLAVGERRQLDRLRQAGQLGVEHRRRQYQRHQRRIRRGDGMPEAADDLPAAAVAAGARQRAAAGRHDDAARVQRAARRARSTKPSAAALTSWTRRSGSTVDLQRGAAAQQRIEHGARAGRRPGRACRSPRASAARPATRTSARWRARRRRRGCCARSRCAPLKSSTCTSSCVTLQRPPPEIRILAPIFAAPSSRTMRSARPPASAAKIAAARPAAPPPMMARSQSSPMGVATTRTSPPGV